MPAAKPKLYIIHGWTYTVAPWEKTIAYLKEHGLNVEMLNVPGLTSSSKKVWTIDEYADWADRNIPDGAVALGHSNGGRILLNLCAKKPEKLSHLILLDAAGVYEASKKRDVSRGLSKKLGFLKKVPGLTKVWHKLTGASDYARAPENMKQTLTNMLDSDKSLDISKVSVPTTILWGEQDTITPPHQAEIMHSKIHGSTLEIFPEWNHAPYIAHPRELGRAVLRSVKHPPEIPPEPVEVTQVADASASMALRKAAGPAVQNTADISATLSLKKAAGPAAPDDMSARSASLAFPTKSAKASAAPADEAKIRAAANSRSNSPEPNAPDVEPEHISIVEQLAEVDYEKIAPDIPPAPERKMISTADVPKIPKKEKIRRKLNDTEYIGARVKLKKPLKPKSPTKSKKTPKTPKAPKTPKPKKEKK